MTTANAITITILYRYALSKDYDVTLAADPGDANVSAYAVNAVK